MDEIESVTEQIASCHDQALQALHLCHRGALRKKVAIAAICSCDDNNTLLRSMKSRATVKWLMYMPHVIDCDNHMILIFYLSW